MLFLKLRKWCKATFQGQKKDKGSDYINENLCVWSLKQKTAYTRF